MGLGSQSGQFGLGIQSVKGTAVPATRFARLRGGGLGADRSLLVPDPEIGGNRDIPQAYLGPVGFSGDIDFYPRMEMLAMLLRGALGSSSSSFTAGTNEVQNITITGAPTGGTFTLSYRGQTTAALPNNAAATAIQTALTGLSSIGAGNVVCAGGPLPTAVTVTFQGALATTNPPMLTAVSSLTGGTNPAVAITATTPGAPPVGTHIITGGDTVPFFTVEERDGNTYESFRYVDAKINSLRLESDASGYLMGSANLMALSGVSGFSAQATPAWDTTPMLVGSQVSISFNGSSLRAKSFNLEINNNLEGEDFILGSIFGDDLTEKRREIKMSVTRRPNDSSLWRSACWGALGNNPVAGPAFSGPATITVSSYEFITGTTPFSLTVDIPSCVIAPFKVTPNGDDVIQEDIEITLTRPDPLVPIATFTVRNDLATIS